MSYGAPANLHDYLLVELCYHLTQRIEELFLWGSFTIKLIIMQHFEYGGGRGRGSIGNDSDLHVPKDVRNSNIWIPCTSFNCVCVYGVVCVHVRVCTQVLK